MNTPTTLTDEQRAVALTALYAEYRELCDKEITSGLSPAEHARLGQIQLADAKAQLALNDGSNPAAMVSLAEAQAHFAAAQLSLAMDATAGAAPASSPGRAVVRPSALARVQAHLEQSAFPDGMCWTDFHSDELRGKALEAVKAALEETALDERLGVPVISPEVAAHVLAAFGSEGGHSAGRFKKTLIDALCFADDESRPLLAGAFPDYAEAIRIIKSERGGVAELQAIAAGRCGPTGGA